MKIKYEKLIHSLLYNQRMPRKIKKAVLGKKMSQSKLNKLLKSVKVIEGADNIFEMPEIYPYLFCPNCGCTEWIGTGNKTSYPEHWENFHCQRCHKIVAMIDNSPFVHCLECNDYNIIS